MQQYVPWIVTIWTLKKKLGCFNPTLGQIWTNPDIGLNDILMTFLTQRLGLSIFDPNVGLK